MSITVRARLASSRRALWIGLLLLLAGSAGPFVRSVRADQIKGPSPAQERYMMPSVTLERYTRAGADSIHAWADRHAKDAADRGLLYNAIARLFRSYERFKVQVAQTYPKNQVEWLLVTDGVADTLADAITPILGDYCRSHPQEILTEGRQQVETLIAGIEGPPAGMLGFHVVILGEFIYSKADSLRRASQAPDIPGLQEGVLRSLADWVQLYHQYHSDPITVYQCRIHQGDWIIMRLEDGCGHSGAGTWKLTEQWMAVVDRDTTMTPAFETYAREYHVHPLKCPKDTTTRVFYVDLPNFNEMEMEVYKRQLEGKLNPANPLQGQ